MRIHDGSRRKASLALLLLLALCLSSFAAKCDKGGGKNANLAARQAEDARAVDDLLRSKVRQDITEKSAASTSGLSALDIEVGVSKRKVTLGGTVKTEAAREEAVRIARESEVEINGEKFKAAEVDASRLTVKPGST